MSSVPNIPMGAITTTVKDCARCGGTHLALVFKTFAHNPIPEANGVVWDYWALCPDTGEPILMKASVLKGDG